MNSEAKRFKQTEKMITAVLITATVLFIIYLIAAGCGVIWLKVITAIITILLCGLCLVYLKWTKLLLRPRTIWMTTASAALIICLLFSLALNFPSKL